LLAEFKVWVTQHYGNISALLLFQTLDTHNKRKLGYTTFARELEAQGFTGRAKALAQMLDWQEKKYLQMDDFALFDIWKPPAWLTAAPNPAAAEAFKKSLKHRYGQPVKGWRVAMDKDNSNSCTFREFQDACKHLRLTSDMAGAWIALDEDLSGFITFKEIDAKAYEALVHFRRWTDMEFGGVRSAFKVLDRDASGNMSYREFRLACRSFGFTRDVKRVFDSLDQNSEGSISFKEAVFLDDWDMPLEDTDGGPSRNSVLQELTFDAGIEQPPTSPTLEYSTFCPGPGAYTIPCTFGCKDKASTKHSSAYSFGNKGRSWLQYCKTKSVGPAKYEPAVQNMVRKKPAWTFANSSRCTVADGSVGIMPRGISVRSLTDDGLLPQPGPGSYDIRSVADAPMFSFQPRRGLNVHPSQRPARPASTPPGRMF